MSSNWLGLSSFGLGAAGMFATVYCTQAILPTLGREFGVGAARTGLTISVVVVAMFSGATAAQIGVATASESDQGSASAIYYSCYYTCGAFAAYLPGVAWQWWGWAGVTGVALGVLAPAAAILVFAQVVREPRPKR